MATAVPPTTPYVLWTDTDPETLRLYSLLPDFIRRADEADTTCTGGYPLLRWLDLQVRWYGSVTALMDRFNFPAVNPVTSELVDPYASDDEWLNWLGQLVDVAVSQTPGVATSATWEFLKGFVDVSANGITEWWEWMGWASQSGPGGNTPYTWQKIQDANLAQRSQLTPVRDAINRRRSLANSYTTARSGYGYYDGNGASIAAAARSVLSGIRYVWVGPLAQLQVLGPVFPTSVTTTGSTTEYFTLAKPVDLGKALVLPGTTGNFASTPDTAVLDITGDIDIVARVFLPDWTPSAQQTVVAKWVGGTNQSYLFSVTTTGALQLSVSATGANTLTATSSAIVPASDGDIRWIRVTRASGTGAVNFFHAADSQVEPTSWTALGTAQTTTAGTMFSGSAPLTLGAYESGGTAFPMNGRIFRTIVRSGIGGTKVFDADFTQQTEGVTTFTESTSKTVTITQGGSQPRAQIYTGQVIRMKMDRSTTSTVANQSMTYGANITVSNTTAALKVDVGTGTVTGTLTNGTRGAIDVWLDFNYPNNCKVYATHTPNGGSASVVINNVSVTHAITRPSGSTVMTFARGLSGVIFSATFDSTICLLTQFAITDQFLKAGTGVASSDLTRWASNGGDSMTYAYASTPYSGVATVSPEWGRIHVVTRSTEKPSDTILLNAIETVRPAGFTIVLRTATEV